MSEPGQSKSGKSEPGQSKSGQSKPGQSEPGQSKSGQSKPGQSKSGQSEPGQSKAGDLNHRGEGQREEGGVVGEVEDWNGRLEVSGRDMSVKGGGVDGSSCGPHLYQF